LRTLALDPGTRRIGVALSDTKGTLAFPRDAIAAGDDAVNAIVAVARDEAVGTIVVGRPLSLAGAETASTAMADQLRGALTLALPEVAIVSHDERLTTKSAERSLREAGRTAREQRSLVDSAAAVVLLQSYLDASTH
jgi:putative Holliday junction resolvase